MKVCIHTGITGWNQTAQWCGVTRWGLQARTFILQFSKTTLLFFENNSPKVLRHSSFHARNRTPETTRDPFI